MKQKALDKFTFVSGWTKGFFLKNRKQQTNTLFEQMSSGRNINNDSIAANYSMCYNTRYHDSGAG